MDDIDEGSVNVTGILVVAPPGKASDAWSTRGLPLGLPPVVAEVVLEYSWILYDVAFSDGVNV
ncbi:MAG: hypothetical protein EBU61_02960, partial [Crocinitomicaceae bacterium]|nr:hypothetical protein [Crocinitomicaceae bacterium]